MAYPHPGISSVRRHSQTVAQWLSGGRINEWADPTGRQVAFAKVIQRARQAPSTSIPEIPPHAPAPVHFLN